MPSLPDTLARSGACLSAKDECPNTYPPYEEILALLQAGCIRGFPQKDKGIYLIHRDGLPLLIHCPQKGRKPKGNNKN